MGTKKEMSDCLNKISENSDPHGTSIHKLKGLLSHFKIIKMFNLISGEQLETLIGIVKNERFEPYFNDDQFLINFDENLQINSDTYQLPGYQVYLGPVRANEDLNNLGVYAFIVPQCNGNETISQNDQECNDDVQATLRRYLETLENNVFSEKSTQKLKSTNLTFYTRHNNMQIIGKSHGLPLTVAYLTKMFNIDSKNNENISNAIFTGSLSPDNENFEIQKIAMNEQKAAMIIQEIDWCKKFYCPQANFKELLNQCDFECDICGVKYTFKKAKDSIEMTCGNRQLSIKQVKDLAHLFNLIGITEETFRETLSLTENNIKSFYERYQAAYLNKNFEEILAFYSNNFECDMLHTKSDLKEIFELELSDFEIKEAKINFINEPRPNGSNMDVEYEFTVKKALKETMHTFVYRTMDTIEIDSKTIEPKIIKSIGWRRIVDFH